jgi:proteasome lid subunit RPN8/RPN11
LFHNISKSLGPASRGRLIPAFSDHDTSETKIEIPLDVRAHDAGEVVFGSTHSHPN